MGLFVAQSFLSLCFSLCVLRVWWVGGRAGRAGLSWVHRLSVRCSLQLHQSSESRSAAPWQPCYCHRPIGPVELWFVFPSWSLRSRNHTLLIRYKEQIQPLHPTLYYTMFRVYCILLVNNPTHSQCGNPSGVSLKLFLGLFIKLLYGLINHPPR